MWDSLQEAGARTGRQRPVLLWEWKQLSSGPLRGTAPVPLQEEELRVVSGVFYVRRGFSMGSCSVFHHLIGYCRQHVYFLKVVAGVRKYIDIPGPKGERGGWGETGAREVDPFSAVPRPFSSLSLPYNLAIAPEL